MNTAYIQKQTIAKKSDYPSASSVLDNSSQSESLQRKADMANNAAQRAEAPRPNNTGMPDNLKSGIESLSGFSMDDVRVHYNSSRPATVRALAYTQGTDIHVAPGQEKHLPHEAWHVAQQMAGRVSPTTNINGMPVNDNTALEHEADVMGEKAVDHRYENESIKKQTISKNNLQRRALVLQLLDSWEKVYDNLYRWPSIRNGVQWYRDDKKNMWYFIPNIEEVPEDLRPGYLYYENERKKRADWEKLHKEWADSELEKYYYHISDRKIENKINPMYNNNPTSREVRGDDLGPGFYMGDFAFMKYYYGKNFFSKPTVYIYYIEKNLIESKNTTDFTKENNSFQITENNDLFQTAMQLGFRYVDEYNAFNHQRPLDLLDPEKPNVLDLEKTDVLDLEKTDFGKCIKNIYGDGDVAKTIYTFFEAANGNSIWKGYINDIDQIEEALNIEKDDLVNYFRKCGIFDNEIAKGLEDTLVRKIFPSTYDSYLFAATNKIRNQIYEFVMDKYNKEIKNQPTSIITEKNYAEYFIRQGINKDFAEGLANALPKNDKEVNLDAPKIDIKNNIYDFVKKNYDAFLQHKKHCKYKSLEINGTKPIQIAIRDKDVEYVKPVEGAEGVNPVEGENVKLLDKIQNNEIIINFENKETESDTKGYLTPELKAVLAVEKEKKEKEAKNSSIENK